MRESIITPISADDAALVHKLALAAVGAVPPSLNGERTVYVCGLPMSEEFPGLVHCGDGTLRYPTEKEREGITRRFSL